MTKTKTLRRLASACIIMRLKDGKPQVYMQNKKKFDQWESPGGKVDPGEKSLEACIREMEEETGLKLRDLIYLGYVETKADWHVSLFACVVPEGQEPYNKEPNKHTDSGWFSLKNLPKKLTKITEDIHKLGYLRMARDRLFGD